MNLTVRKEFLDEKEVIYNLVETAFKSAERSDGNEQNLVNKLRLSPNYIDDLSLVALDGDTIVGHIMFTKASIENETSTYETLALAPLSVCPKYQKKGVGTLLMKEGLKKATELGFESVIVLGSEVYYPRFGFKAASTFDVHAPFEVPDENYMAIELKPNSLTKVSGTVVYAKEFFE